MPRGADIVKLLSRNTSRPLRSWETSILIFSWVKLMLLSKPNSLKRTKFAATLLLNSTVMESLQTTMVWMQISYIWSLTVLSKWTISILGGRTADEIVNWLLKKTGPAAKAIATVDEAKEFASASDVAVLGLFKVKLGSFKIIMHY